MPANTRDSSNRSTESTGKSTNPSLKRKIEINTKVERKDVVSEPCPLGGTGEKGRERVERKVRD